MCPLERDKGRSTQRQRRFRRDRKVDVRKHWDRTGSSRTHPARLPPKMLDEGDDSATECCRQLNERKSDSAPENNIEHHIDERAHVSVLRLGVTHIAYNQW
jgi:hypothetical protein